MERSQSIAVTLIGLTTMIWGGVHIALPAFCDVPGSNWTDSAVGFAPIHRIAGGAYYGNVDIAFKLQGILGMLAGSGVLLRLQWGRVLTFIVAVVALLWALDAVDAFMQQDDHYQWKTALIPYAAAQVVYGVLAVFILIKNGAAFSEPEGSGQSGVGRPFYVWAAWASPCVGVAVFVALWVMVNDPHPGARGERPPAVSLFIVLVLSSAAGGLAGVVSLFGIRSRRGALSIVPVALLGICIDGFLAFICLAFYLYAGTRP